jgi:hypothetical protein
VVKIQNRTDSTLAMKRSKASKDESLAKAYLPLAPQQRYLRHVDVMFGSKESKQLQFCAVADCVGLSFQRISLLFLR